MISNKKNMGRLSSGIEGLDEILGGGFLQSRAYFIQGGPGAGKTTLGFHFLAKGARLGEKVLFITLEEPIDQLKRDAKSLNIDLNGVNFLDLSPGSEYFSKVKSYDIFSPGEVEREPITKKITDIIDKLKPKRVFLDPISQLRYLTSDIFQFRREVLSFLRYLTENDATVLFTSEGSVNLPDDDLQFMSDGIIKLDFNKYGRNISILKFRGSDFIGKTHTLKIENNGVKVFPSLIPENYSLKYAFQRLSFGISELDQLTCGGLERGTTTFICGHSGVGKTSLALQFIKETAKRGERSLLFSFEEEIEIIKIRAESINIKINEMLKNGQLLLKKIEPLEFTPDEFSKIVRDEIELNKSRVVVIDSLAGYKLCMRGSNLEKHIRALTRYLQNMGITTIIILEDTNLIGDFKITDSNISYMADNIIFLRYIERKGELHRVIGVLKKRLSDFEKALREFKITEKGIIIGKPLNNLRGILSGVPVDLLNGEGD